MRAFLVCMRDKPMDAPIPESIEPSPYHADELEKAERTVIALSEMTPDEQEAHGAFLKSHAIRRASENLSKRRLECKRLSEMRIAVSAWTPPTPDHQEFKAFMLQQIDVSSEDLLHATRRLERAERRSPQDYYDTALLEAQDDVKYHAEELDRERSNAAESTAWLHALQDGLGD